ncbi:MAG: pyroglutamyl-peptidase I [Alphaproteobacteria bacterium]|nr:MAG: pyroglutamyl-peptidase I [Alphaproteobacteria bacterium]
MTTVLITGFGRFPGAPFNPSGPLALALAKRRRPAFADVHRAVHIFETSYASVDRDLPKLLARHRPDIVLMFGLAARTPFVRIETRARNTVSILFPDVTGFRPNARAIAAGMPDARGQAPFARLLGAARASRAPSRVSRDAGRYLCNYVYWRALEASRSGTLAQFIHIPPVANVRRRPGKKRRVTQAALVRAGEAILLALLAARRH